MTSTPSPSAPKWSPASWRSRAATQQPDWPDQSEAAAVCRELATYPALVFAGEARTLQGYLAAAAAGEAFVLQAGDCAESFSEFSAPEIREKLRVILQMTVVLAYSAGVPVVKIGRMAGQYGKPRSSPQEERDGTTLPSFRGHIVNDDAFDAAGRRHDPRRMVDAYFRSAATLNLLRAFTRGGFGALGQVQQWNQDFVARSPAGERFRQVADGITRSLRFMGACGLPADHPNLVEAEVFTSHEALVLDYEEALCRRDSLTGVWFDTSAHMLWVGERTRDPNGAHVEFCSGVANPLGVKVGPGATGEELVALCERLNPERIPGRLSFITRMGAGVLPAKLPGLVAAVREAGHPVVWLCDPMHGNTRSTPSGRKTRNLADIVTEVEEFFRTHRACGSVPGGLHLELTGNDVTECVGGAEQLGEDDLGLRYETTCDPRLNASQAIELAFLTAELIGESGREDRSAVWVRDDESGELLQIPRITPYPR